MVNYPHRQMRIPGHPALPYQSVHIFPGTGSRSRGRSRSNAAMGILLYNHHTCELPRRWGWWTWWMWLIWEWVDLCPVAWSSIYTDDTNSKNEVIFRINRISADCRLSIYLFVFCKRLNLQLPFCGSTRGPHELLAACSLQLVLPQAFE